MRQKNFELENDNKGVLEMSYGVIFLLRFRPRNKKKIVEYISLVIYEFHIHKMKTEVQKAKNERARKMSDCVLTTAVLNTTVEKKNTLMIIKQVIYETTKLWLLFFHTAHISNTFFFLHFELDHSRVDDKNLKKLCCTLFRNEKGNLSCLAA